jgi:hypothetical protein
MAVTDISSLFRQARHRRNIASQGRLCPQVSEWNKQARRGRSKNAPSSYMTHLALLRFPTHQRPFGLPLATRLLNACAHAPTAHAHILAVEVTAGELSTRVSTGRHDDCRRCLPLLCNKRAVVAGGILPLKLSRDVLRRGSNPALGLNASQPQTRIAPTTTTKRIVSFIDATDCGEHCEAAGAFAQIKRPRTHTTGAKETSDKLKTSGSSVGSLRPPHQVQFCSATWGRGRVAALTAGGTLLFCSAFKGSKEKSDENCNRHPRHNFPRCRSGRG